MTRRPGCLPTDSGQVDQRRCDSRVPGSNPIIVVVSPPEHPVSTIALNRRFAKWQEKDALDPELLSGLGIPDGQSGWDDLLAKRRVVLLAEAGSGKTVEMTEQARLQTNAGRFAFYVTVEDVGREGLDRALSVGDRSRLLSWRTSTEDAWFLIDSVDEAKLVGVRLEKAVRQLADGIAGAERRAHVVLSCRLTDWESRRDLERLEDGLSIPLDPVLLEPPSQSEVLISTIRQEPRKEQSPTVEEPLIVVMMPLDPGRVRLFAEAKGTQNLGEFLAQIEAGDLWRFARRPLDLDWLVQFWQVHNRLGSLAEMLENSLTQRLKETNPERGRHDSLDVSRAVRATERIGAALVFGRKANIAIPDSALTFATDDSFIDLADVLPDWSPEDRGRLLTRPVFDPATFGRARIHNDNQGVVRGYLTARWLRRLIGENLQRRSVFDLLFANTYGLELVKPSVRGTAAWLAIWDVPVAREILRRDPTLLFTDGDPASLPVDVRRDALTRVVEQIGSGDQEPQPLPFEAVKRFARADLSEAIRALWAKYQGRPEVCELLLRIIWLGGIKDCADLAAGAVFGNHPDRDTKIVAGRALVATGDDQTKRRYAEYIKASCATLPDTMVLKAIESLFPDLLNVDDLLKILRSIEVTAGHGTAGASWLGSNLPGRVGNKPDIEKLLGGLLEQLGGEPSTRGRALDKREAAYFPAIAATAIRLLEFSSEDDAPDLVIDATLRLAEHRTIRDAAAKIGMRLRQTAARRRLAFWKAAERLNCRPGSRHPIVTAWQMTLSGYSPGLCQEDLDWLLTDGPIRQAEHDRRLTINAAMLVWRENGARADIRARIETVARLDTAMNSAYESWVNPTPPTAEETESERELKEFEAQNAAAQGANERSWIDFADRLRSNPELRQLRPRGAEDNDTRSRLYDLWCLLDKARARYAIDSVAPLEPMFGREVADAVRDGLIAHWRSWRPELKSTKGLAGRNAILSFDCMGIAGVTLEARSRPQWAERLTPEEAALAARYATLEINGFPWWLAELARAKPKEVGAVLISEITAELAVPDDPCEVLRDTSQADASVIRLVAPALLDELEQRPDLRPAALLPMLRVITSGLQERQTHFVELAVSRLNNTSDMGLASLCLGAAFSVDPSITTDALMAKLDTLAPDDQTALVGGFLPLVFGDGYSAAEFRSENIPFYCLERLVWIAHRAIQLKDDLNHAPGNVYSPGARDHAEHARGVALRELVDTPGRATFEAIRRLAEAPDCPLRPSWLRMTARERAASDAESAPWLAGDPHAFEQSHDAAPRTARDLQLVALRRLDDLQHELLHGDFAQGATVRALPDETAVQNWVAHYLRLKQGRAYSVEREPHVVDEKEPDIRLRGSATDVCVAIEIKVAESWTLEKLEEALTNQLCGLYLRAKDARHGILLLVNQELRPKGWRDQAGVYLSFDGVVSHLQSMAARIAGTSPDSPQAEIAVINVSMCGRDGSVSTSR